MSLAAASAFSQDAVSRSSTCSSTSTSRSPLSRIAEQHQPGRIFLQKHKDRESISAVLQAWRSRVEEVRTELSRRGAPVAVIDGSHEVSANVPERFALAYDTATSPRKLNHEIRVFARRPNSQF